MLPNVIVAGRGQKGNAPTVTPTETGIIRMQLIQTCVSLFWRTRKIQSRERSPPRKNIRSVCHEKLKLATISWMRIASSEFGLMNKTASETLCASKCIHGVVAMGPLKGRSWGGNCGRCFARVQYIGHSGQQCIGSERLLEERTVEIHLVSGVRRDE